MSTDTKNQQITTAAYFDCNATTPVLPVAAEAALMAMNTLYGNPSSSHLTGMQAKFILENARKTLSRAVGADPQQIIFTSGATEAIQTAVFSVLQEARTGAHGARTRLLYSATEHKAVPQALEHWVKALGLPFQVVEIPVDGQGQLNLEILRGELPHALLLCTMAVNNETGVIQDLGAIEKILNETLSNCRWLVDCVQALGKLPLQLEKTRIDYAPFSGHKIYAPKGIGFLYLRKGAPFAPLIVGGGQERGMRSGTENLPGVAALGAVIEHLQQPGGKFQPHERLLEFRDRLAAELKRAFPKVEFNMPFETSVPTTINFSVPGFSSKELMDLFDSAGMRLSAGSACSSTSVKPSHVLDAMKFPEWRSTSALRLSFGPCTTEAEIKRGTRVIRECAIALQSSCLLNAPGGFEAPETLRDGILQFRSGSSNSWVAAHRDNRTCIVIDPCESVAERMEHYIRCQGLQVLAIIDTHSHGDHESVRPVLQKILADRMLPEAKCDDLGWPLDAALVTTATLAGGTRASCIKLGPARDGRGELVLARIHTPGHTDDSHVLFMGSMSSGKLAPNDILFAFSGDTILSGGLGRTNFSMSDPEALFNSLRGIHAALGSRSLLCPAHDYNNSFATSLETEVRENPILALAVNPPSHSDSGETLKLFISKKREIDSELESIERNFQGIVCGVANTGQGPCDTEMMLTHDELKRRLSAKNDDLLVIDVREPQEFSLFKDWGALGLSISPRNVPLSRFVNFISELASSDKKPPEVLLICLSGSRSLQAAKSLRRLGLAKAWSLKDGIAF